MKYSKFLISFLVLMLFFRINAGDYNPLTTIKIINNKYAINLVFEWKHIDFLAGYYYHCDYVAAKAIHFSIKSRHGYFSQFVLLQYSASNELNKIENILFKESFNDKTKLYGNIGNKFNVCNSLQSVFERVDESEKNSNLSDYYGKDFSYKSLIKYLTPKYKGLFVAKKLYRFSSDLAEKDIKNIKSKLKKFILSVDMKNNLILDYLGTPLPSTINIFLMPSRKNCDRLIYYYSNTVDKCLRTVYLNADGSFDNNVSKSGCYSNTNENIESVDWRLHSKNITMREHFPEFFEKLVLKGWHIKIDSNQINKQKKH